MYTYVPATILVYRHTKDVFAFVIRYVIVVYMIIEIITLCRRSCNLGAVFGYYTSILHSSNNFVIKICGLSAKPFKLRRAVAVQVTMAIQPIIQTAVRLPNSTRQCDVRRLIYFGFTAKQSRATISRKTRLRNILLPRAPASLFQCWRPIYAKFFVRRRPAFSSNSPAISLLRTMCFVLVTIRM